MLPPKPEAKKLKPEPEREFNGREEGCTCFLGHPPCGFCTSYNPDDEEEAGRGE